MIIKVGKKRLPRLHIRLHKVDQNNLFWILFFRDPVYHFVQSMVVPKTVSPEEMEELWDTMWVRCREKLAGKMN